MTDSTKRGVVYLNSKAGKKPSDDDDMEGMGMGFKVGARVQVKDGSAHDDMTKGKKGTVVQISTPALGIKFDGMKAVHKWYVAEELKKAE